MRFDHEVRAILQDDSLDFGAKVARIVVTHETLLSDERQDGYSEGYNDGYRDGQYDHDPFSL